MVPMASSEPVAVLPARSQRRLHKKDEASGRSTELAQRTDEGGIGAARAAFENRHWLSVLERDYLGHVEGGVAVAIGKVIVSAP